MEQSPVDEDGTSGYQNLDDLTYVVRIPLNERWVQYNIHESDGTFRKEIVFPRRPMISSEVIAELDQWDADNPVDSAGK